MSDRDRWETIGGPYIHPADTHLSGRSAFLHGGHLLRNRQTGSYVLEMAGSHRSLPQDWARERHAEARPAMTPAEYRAVRQSLGWSQARLADELGVTRETISRRESGDPRAPIDREADLAIRSLVPDSPVPS